MPDDDKVRRECRIRGVDFEVISDQEAAQILTYIASPSQNMEAVQLEKAPKVALKNILKGIANESM